VRKATKINDAGTGPVLEYGDAVGHFFCFPVLDPDYGYRNADVGIRFSMLKPSYPQYNKYTRDMNT
jgi:hypothetical protein